ncbi:hypothetical protein ACQP1K_27330 [Sphaerimonospora sp. CA-214678]
MYAEVATGFSVGLATAWQYFTETITLLARRAPPRLTRRYARPRRPDIPT